MLRAASLAAVSLLATVVVACGGGAAAGEADPARAVPADAWMYVEATVRPDGKRKDDALDAAGKVLATDDPEGKLRELLDKALADGGGTDLDYDRDIKPWLGDRVGVWVGNRLDAEGDPGAAAVIAVTDPDAAVDAFHKAARQAGDRLTKRSYNGVDYEVDQDGSAVATVGDFLLAGTEPEVKQSIDAQKGDSLAESDRYRGGVDKLDDERLAHFYMDLRRLFELLGQQEPNNEEMQQFRALVPFEKLPPVFGSFSADADRLSLDMAATSKGLGNLGALGTWGGGATPLMQELPGDSWAAFGSAKYGQSLKAAFDTYAGAFGGAAIKQQLRNQYGIDIDDDLLSWIGDIAAFVRGDTIDTLDGGLVIQVIDDAKAEKGFAKLVGLLQSGGGADVNPVTIPGAKNAFAVRDTSVPKPIILARSDERVVVSYGVDAAKAALNPDGKLGDADIYHQAEDKLGMDPAFVMSMPTVLSLVDASGQADADFQQVRPYLQPYDVIAYGAEAQGDGGRFRLVAGLK